MQADVFILGGGPGGYPAAFRLAAAGQKVVMADTEATPGGVCLHHGCIPSKALLHAASVLSQATEAASFGIRFGRPDIDLGAVRRWRDGITSHHGQALARQADRLGIVRLHGRARFADPQHGRVTTPDGDQEVAFRHAIVATGSVPLDPGLGIGRERVMDSTEALKLQAIPARLLVVGGGYIGLELGLVYAALGAAVSVAEMTPGLLPGVDPDLVAPVASRLGRQFASIRLETAVAALRLEQDHVTARLEPRSGGAPAEERFDAVLVAVGRRPATDGIGLEQAGVAIDGRGHVVVDNQRRTSRPHIFAVGDAAGNPMLAHKATAEARVAAESILGRGAVMDVAAMPAVVYTDPEIAWCGLTEAAAAQAGTPVSVSRFPWSASGRAATRRRPEGMTKLLTDPATGRVLGAGMVGAGAGELIAEAVLAIEMGAVAEDLALCVHPHPTLSETLMEAAAAARHETQD